MSKYRKTIDPSQEQTWNRYVVELDDGALAELVAKIEVRAEGYWSFKLAGSHPDDDLSIDPKYVFFFEQPSDVILVRDFDLDRNRC